MSVSPVPPTVAARHLTEQLQAAMTGDHRTLARLADRTRAAHERRVWTALGYSGRGPYAEGELGISRAQAHRLLDIADTLHTLTRAAARAGAMSPAGDTPADAGAPAAALWDFGLPQLALRDIAPRASQVADEMGWDGERNGGRAVFCQ